MPRLKVSKVSEIPKVSKAKKLSSLSNSPNPSRSSPQTMEELLAMTGYQIHGLKRGETIIGTVVNITPKAVVVDIGAKNEGVVMERGYDAAAEYIKTLKVGDKISAQVVTPEAESGQIILSLKRSASSSAWQKLAEAKKNKEEIEVVVKEVNRAGLIVEAYNLEGFIPVSQVGNNLRNRLEELVGKRIKVQIRELDEAQEKLVFSEKAVSEQDQILKVEEALEKVKMAEEYKGTVSGVTPFGIFVQVLVDGVGVEGLVHISEIAWEKTEDPASIFAVNQEVNVKVIGIDKEAGRLALSLKQLAPDPWQEKIKKYVVESHVSGIVTKLTSFGVFIEIEPNVTGLVHISKIPAEKSVNVGDKLNCFVEAIEPDKRRLSLGLVLTEKPVGYK